MGYNCKFNELPEVLQRKYANVEIKGCYINPETDDITITLADGQKHYLELTRAGWVRVDKHGKSR